MTTKSIFYARSYNIKKGEFVSLVVVAAAADDTGAGRQVYLFCIYHGIVTR